MYLRRCFRQKDGKRHAYWALVESYRTARGPRQRVVSYLGEMDANGRVGIRACAEGKHQYELFDGLEPEWVEVDVKRVSVERKCDFGGPWLGLELCRSLGLPEFLDTTIATGREDIPWPMMALVLVLGRLCDPSSELHLAEHSFAAGALGELLGIPAEKVNDDRLYRALDKLLPHKKALEKHLKEKLGTLFSLDYDLLLYDVTSTFFEGQAEANELAQRGYSRDHRSDCKQVNLALVVSRCGMPVGYELFAGNTADVTTVEDMVEHVEGLYGKANRIWVMDRGMTSRENVEFLQQEGRRYIIGTPKSMLKQFERELVEGDWKQVHEGLEVQLCPGPDGAEVFILCRSAQRSEKEHAMHERFEKKIAAGLEKIAEVCRKRKQKAGEVERRVGQLLGRNTRAAGLFEVRVAQKADGFVEFTWVRREAWRQWANNSEGCYLLRSNVTDWTPEELWRAYIQLTEAEAAFRIHKSDLQLRPVWHQKRERVEAHILVCFLGYVLWKTLGQFCRQAELGDEPRKVFDEISQIALVDVVLPTRGGVSIRKRCVAKPTDHQAILLQRLGLHLPTSLRKFDL
jgi:transposase